MTEQTTPEILSEEALKEIEKRIASVPEGPWFAASDAAKECGPHRDSGLALVDTGRESDWPIARLCEWHKARFIAASITDIPALCQTVRAAWAEINRLRQLSTDQTAIETALRDQLAQVKLRITDLENETAKNSLAGGRMNTDSLNEREEAPEQHSPAWTCAICGTFCESAEVLKNHQCPSPYRIMKYGNGYEASMWTHSGGGSWFWTPLLATGYWAEPESFSTGSVKGLHLLDTFGEAEKAIERAKLINATGRILNIADDK